jgi:hypothetical protein
VEPEPQRDAVPAPAAPATTAPALNLMFNIDGISKMSQNVTVSYFSHSRLLQFQSYKIRRKKLPHPFCQILFVLKSWLGI